MDMTSKTAADYPKVGQAATRLPRGLGPDIPAHVPEVADDLIHSGRGLSVSNGQQAPQSPSLLHREKKPKEVMGGFSRRCSKLINSCEYLETDL